MSPAIAIHCEGFPPESYAFYVLGAGEYLEQSIIERHVFEGCIACKKALKEAESIWERVALTAPELPVDHRLRSRVLTATMSSGGGRKTQAWRMTILAFAGVVLAVVCFVGGERLAPRKTLTITSYLAEPQPPQGGLRTGGPPVPASAFHAPDPVAAVASVSTSTSDGESALRAELASQRSRTDALAAELEQRLKALATDEVTLADLRTRFTETTRREEASRAQNEDLRRQVSAVSERATELETQVVKYRNLLNDQGKRLANSIQVASLISDPSLRIIPMKGTEKGQSARGRVIVGKSSSRVVLFASDLPQLPDARIYQLWLIRSRVPTIVSGGVFDRTGASTEVSFALPSSALVDDVTTIALTDEPRGGSALPTGHKWMIGF